MTSSFLYRKLSQSYSAGPVEGVFGAADEERIYDMPNLVSWFSADPSYFDGTSVYRDKGPHGNNWVQATVGQQPALVSNWQSTGWPALAFDGISSRIPANFNAPVGPMTLVAVVDSVISNTSQCIVGSNIQSTGSQQWAFEILHGNPVAFCVTKSAWPGNSGGTVGATSAPMVVVGNFNPIAETLDVQINGGSWTTTTAAASPNIDVTMQLGAYRTNTGDIYSGHMAEVMAFTSAMKGTADLATVVAAMKAKYGIA